MTEVQDSWKEVSSKAEALGLKLKLHLEQEQDGESERQEGDTKQMVDEFGRKLGDAFDSMGNAAKDPAVHEDVKDLGRLFKDALMATFQTVGAEVQSRTQTGSSDADEHAAHDAATADVEAIDDPSSGDDTGDGDG